METRFNCICPNCKAEVDISLPVTRTPEPGVDSFDRMKFIFNSPRELQAWQRTFPVEVPAGYEMCHVYDLSGLMPMMVVGPVAVGSAAPPKPVNAEQLKLEKLDDAELATRAAMANVKVDKKSPKAKVAADVAAAEAVK
jgi:hypothetical protein